MIRTTVIVVAFSCSVLAQNARKPIEVNVDSVMASLVAEEDTDGDRKITIDDQRISQSERGDKQFWLVATTGERYEVNGTYFLSNLLQELNLSKRSESNRGILDFSRVFEPPVDRISRSIREYYWNGLTRRLDEQGLTTTLADEKTSTLDGFNYVYVPSNDTTAYEFFRSIAYKKPGLKLKVVRLAKEITPQYVRALNGYHGILSLGLVKTSNEGYEGVPFVVPGGRFNEMYGWDSYFIVLGLLQDGFIDLAKAMVDNFVYQITYYDKILNANRTYFLTRSQPPFLTSMALAIYDRLPKNSASKKWIKEVLIAAIKEYNEVWMNSVRLTELGLSRYFDVGVGPPPEVEEGHFNTVYALYAKKYKMDVRSFEQAYTSGKIKVPELDVYFVHDRCMRESGHDTSYRLEWCCADLVTVDLNSLLYKFELDIGRTIEKEFDKTLALDEKKKEQSAEWFQRAEKRKQLVNKYLWSGPRGMFFDYDIVSRRQQEYVNATAWYPMWAGLATKEQAAALMSNALPLLEMAGGVVSSTEESRGTLSSDRPARQWDYPNGWAPHQMVAWQALMNYGYRHKANRLMYRWLYTITVNAANYNGTIPEKFDVVKRTHRVFAEYGNVGTKFAYITREGFGWTNASYQVGLSLLPDSLRVKLNELIPPEKVF